MALRSDADMACPGAGGGAGDRAGGGAGGAVVAALSAVAAGDVPGVLVVLPGSVVEDVVAPVPRPWAVLRPQADSDTGTSTIRAPAAMAASRGVRGT